MSKLHPRISTRSYQSYLTMSLVCLFGMMTLPSFGQCPTNCPTTYSRTINMDALPACGAGVAGADFIGDIGNANQQTTCLDGRLRCFEFIFQRSDATAPESLTFPIGQGAGCNGEIDTINVSINGVCSRIWAGGSNANVTLNFPVGVTEIKLYGCLNSAAFIKICGLCRATAGCTPSVTCPTIAPAPVSCTAIPAAVTTAAQFVALGGGAAINNCGQAVTITATDEYSSLLACEDRTLTRTYTITIGAYSQTCVVTYPVLAATAATLPPQPDREVACGTVLVPSTLNFTNSLTGACGVSGTSLLSTFVTATSCTGIVVTETWTATDACGRLASVSRTITCNSGLSCATTKIRDANCGASNGSASVALTGGVAASYRWDNNETTAIATQLTQGLHSVTVTTTTGCTTSCSVLIGNVTNLNCSVVENNPASCKGANGSATVTATGGSANVQYVWDNGETTATATRLTAGTHEVKVISGNCSKFCSINITTTGENLRMGACSKTDAGCGKNNGSVTAGVISGQAGTLYFTWRNAANQIVGTTGKVSNLPAGTYKLTLRDACAEVTCTVTVGTAGSNLTCTATATKAASCKKNDGAATVKVTGGASLTYKWDNGETTATATKLSAGIHSVTVTDTKGCASTCSVKVEQLTKDCGGEPKHELHFYPVATSCCTYTNGSSKPIEHLSYKAKKHDRVTEITPNTFYYYAKIVAPSSDFTVNIVQTKDVADFKFLGLNQDYIQLWDAGCSKSVKGALTTEGQGKVSIQGAKVGATYILAVRLDTKSLLNTACKAELPDVTYTLASYINNELVKNSKGSITLKPNYQPAHLNAGKCSKRAPENGVEEETPVNASILVQPNPAQSAVTVTFESVSMSESLISVANINGAIVQTMNYEARQGENTVLLNIQELPAGTYIVTVKTAYQWMTKQLVILR